VSIHNLSKKLTDYEHSVYIVNIVNKKERASVWLYSYVPTYLPTYLLIYIYAYLVLFSIFILNDKRIRSTWEIFGEVEL